MEVPCWSAVPSLPSSWGLSFPNEKVMTVHESATPHCSFTTLPSVPITYEIAAVSAAPEASTHPPQALHFNPSSWLTKCFAYTIYPFNVGVRA